MPSNDQGVTFYFIRHGQTYFNLYERMQGWSNAPLTKEGIQDVRRSGRGLANIHFDAIYSSDLRRTIDTAKIIHEENHHSDGLEIVPMPEFREVWFGSFEGLPVEDVWPKIKDQARIQHDIPAGSDVEIRHLLNTMKTKDPYGHAENYIEFWFRVESGLLKLLNRHAGTGHNVLVSCHGLTIRNLIEGLVADFDQTDALKNASVSIVKYHNGQFHLEVYNQVDHFKDEAEEASQHS